MKTNQQIKKGICYVRRWLDSTMRRFGLLADSRLCDNVVLWSQGWEGALKKIQSPFLINHQLPSSIVSEPVLKRRFELVNGLGYPSQHLVEIPGAIVNGYRGMIEVKPKCFVVEGHWRSSNVVENPIWRGEWPMERIQHLCGNWCSLMGRNGSQLFHWTWDELPRYFSAIPHLPPDIRFLIASDISPYQLETLEAIGVSTEKLKKVGPFERFKIESLWFPTPLGHSETAATHPEVVRSLRERILGYYKIISQKSDRRLFISRRDASYRRLENEEQILAVLKPFGFELVQPEKLSFVDQVKTFSEAEVIVAQHGAGLTNMLYAASGCQVIELHGPVTRVHYWMMACVLGHDYDCVVGEHAENIANEAEPDFKIDTEKLVTVLSRIKLDKTG